MSLRGSHRSLVDSVTVIRGTKVGNYQIEEQIGEGGMGVVYSAKHARMTGRAVVKVLHKQFAHNETIAKRFENEANAAASIGHPGIVQIFDVGKAQDGSLYIVMELLEGEGLQQRVNRLGKLPLSQALSIVRQAAGALGAAHSAGIVHRDLKPDNIFLVPDPEVPGGERVKLLDFGIAKLSDTDTSGMNTGTGAMLGTPHYMSPEQCRGAGEVDHRTDLYALGCILFLLITGRTPFVGTGAGEFIVQHLTQAPPAMGTFDAEAPGYLEDLVGVLLAKDPEERFQSTDALISALDGFAPSDTANLSTADVANAQTRVPGPSAHPIQAVPTTLGANAGPVLVEEPSTAVVRKPRSKLLLPAALSLVVAGAAGAVFIAQSRNAKTASPPSPPVAKPALTPPNLGLAALERYKNPMGSAISDFNSKAWWQAVAADFKQAATQDGAPPLWRAGEVLATGFVALVDSEFDTAVEQFQAATRLAPDWSIGQAALSIGLSRQHKYDEALSAAHEAQRLAPAWSGAIAAGARVLVNTSEFDGAIQEYRRAIAMDKKNPNLLAELSLVYHVTHLDSEAVRYAEMALAIDENLVAPRILLAERALEIDDAQTALTEAGRAVATSPRSLSAHLAYADALALNKDKAGALIAYEKVLELHDARADPNSEHAGRVRLVRKAVARKRLPPTRATLLRRRSKQTDGETSRSKDKSSPTAKPSRSKSGSSTRSKTPTGRSVDRNDPISEL